MAASIAAEENGILAGKEVASTVTNPSEEKCDTDEEMILVNFANLGDGMITNRHYYHMTCFWIVAYIILFLESKNRVMMGNRAISDLRL